MRSSLTSAKAGFKCTLLTQYGNTGNCSYKEGIVLMDPPTVEILMTAALLEDMPGVLLALAAVCRYGRYSYTKKDK